MIRIRMKLLKEKNYYCFKILYMYKDNKTKIL
jgi:hypothetical protein